MHATISVGDGVIMGSDMPSNFGPAPAVGNNFSISYSPKNREEADELFGKISEGGSVTMPLGVHQEPNHEKGAPPMGASRYYGQNAGCLRRQHGQRRRPSGPRVLSQYWSA